MAAVVRCAQLYPDDIVAHWCCASATNIPDMGRAHGRPLNADVTLANIVFEAFRDADASIRLGGIKIVESILGAKAEGGAGMFIARPPGRESSNCCGSGILSSRAQWARHLDRSRCWHHLLSDYLRRACLDPDHNVRTSALGCFARASNQDWAHLYARPNHDGRATSRGVFCSRRLGMQAQCHATFVHLAICDANAAVRAAAARVLGAIASVPSFQAPMFACPAALALAYLLVGDESLAVRSRAATAASHLCFDRGLAAKPAKSADSRNRAPAFGKDALAGSLPQATVQQLVRACLQAAIGDHDVKVAPSALRAMGYLLKYFACEASLPPGIRGVAQNICAPSRSCERCNHEACENASGPWTLAQCGAAMLTAKANGSVPKLRWTACYGLQNYLEIVSFSRRRNQDIPRAFSLVPAILTLLDAVENCQIFKVRVGAMSALSAATRRRVDFGDGSTGAVLGKLWPVLLVAFKTLDNDADADMPTGVRYRKDLQCALSRNIVQLTLLTRPCDLRSVPSATTALALASTFLCDALETMSVAIADEDVRRRTFAAAAGLFDSLLATYNT